MRQWVQRLMASPQHLPHDAAAIFGEAEVMADEAQRDVLPAEGSGRTESAAPPLLPDVPLALLRMEFVYEAVVDIAPTRMLGEGPIGERRIVPILGGQFAGPRLRGKVLPGGADRQLIRRDGVRRLDAFYEMQAEDGAVITVRNQVVIDPGQDGASDYRFSWVELTAPEGPHGWLNRRVFVGTLNSLRPQREAVLVRVYQVG